MNQDDLALLQGRWIQVSYERDGILEPVDVEKGWQPITEISGNNFTVTISDGSTVLNGTFALGSAQGLKTIDWQDTSGSYASTNLILAIYTLTATSFVFCAAYDGVEYPIEFKTKPGLVLRRMERMRDVVGV